MTTIGLVYDLRADYLAEGYSPEQVAEFDSQSTVDAIADALRRLGHAVDRVGHARALCRRLVAGDRWDLVFNIAEGLAGRSREAQVPALLELYNIPYTFSDPLVCAATLDKAVAKRLVAAAGVPTPAFHVVRRPGDLPNGQLTYPLFAKPLAEGTGKGVDARSRVDSPAQLAAICRDLLDRFRQPVLVEEYLPGREFTTAVLGQDAGARAVGTMEVAYTQPGAAIYSYDVKERCEQLCNYTMLPPGPFRSRVEQVALQAYRALECRDAGRVDIRLDPNGQPSFMEINPLPGLHPDHSDLPMIATAAGLPYTQLIADIVAAALTRIQSAETTESRIQQTEPLDPAQRLGDSVS